MKLPFDTSLVPRDVWKNIVSLVLVIGGLVVLFHYFDIETLRGQIEAAGAIAPVLFILSKASTIVISPLVGAPLYPIAGALFGFWYGVALLIAGDVLGGVIAFFLARHFGRPLVEWMLGAERGVMRRALDMMSTTKGYAVARLCFITAPELASYGAGLTKIAFVPFALIYTAIGAIPIIALAWLGDALAYTSGGALVPFATLGAFVISSISLGIFLWLIREKRQESAEADTDLQSPLV